MKNSKCFTLLVFFILFQFIGLECSELHFAKEIRFPKDLTLRKIVIAEEGIFSRVEDDWSIIQFDHSGESLKKYARLGEGPGEFKFLSDFAVSKSVVIGVGNRKLCKYKFSGAIDKEATLKMRIANVVAVNDAVYVLTKKTFKSEIGQTQFFFHLYDESNRLLLDFPNEELQRAVHPASGKRPPFPWFPSPFFNRPIALAGKSGDVAVFMTREHSFKLIDKDQKVKTISIDFQLKAPPITSQDKEDFFSMIKPEPKKITTDSVEFPKTKELFLSVIRWGDGWALVCRDSIFIMTYEGKFKEKIDFPKKLKENEIWETGRPENFLYNYQNQLYFINNNESIFIFQIK